MNIFEVFCGEFSLKFDWTIKAPPYNEVNAVALIYP